MLDPSTIRRLRRLQVRSRRAVNQLLAGRYQSVFRGAGIAFEDVREYQIGDDVRTIDWNVTARMGQPYIKRFRQEREQAVLLMLDVSSSQEFGSGERTKRETGAELCALLAVSVVSNNDRCGLILFTDRVELYLPPAKTTGHVFRLIRAALYSRPLGRGTDLGLALGYLHRVTRRRAVVFLVSDFLADDYDRPLRIAARRHDLIAVRVVDRCEQTLPAAGLAVLQDAESGRRVLVDTGSRLLRASFLQTARRRAELFADCCRSANVDAIEVVTDQPLLEPLVQFFQRRERRWRH